MTIGIIDDEVHNRLVLRNIITSHFKNTSTKIIVDEGLIEIAIEKINSKQPDLIFLDIQLKNGTGFDIIEKLKYSPIIILTTAYSQYAIKAIKKNVFDYLLKPINEKELIESIERTQEKTNELLLYQANNTNASDGFYNYSTSAGKFSINLNEIYYFESAGSYSFMATAHKKIILSKNIGEIEKEINSDLFFRTHSGFIVNMSVIKTVESKRNGEVILLNNIKIPVSQRRVKEFLSQLKSF